jgi:type III secretory pathway component EscS
MEDLIQEALTVVILLSVIPMTAIAAGAGLVTVLQAITQVQEQSLTHLARLAILAAVVIICGDQGYVLLEQIFYRALSMTSSLDVR